MSPMSRELPLLLAVFLDLVGFGMAFPDIQLRAEKFGAPGVLIGLLLSSYFIVQILASPRWGRLSDHIGRKPVLLICTALSVLSMVAYAFADTLWLILASRVLAGLAAANVVVAQAFIADTSTESDRPAKMGRIGAAITAGLIAGPALGGYLADTGGNYLMGLSAAGASTFSLIWIWIGVPNLPAQQERQPGKLPFIDLRLLTDLAALRRLFILASVSWFALACLEGTFGRLIKALFGYGTWEFGVVYSFESFVGVWAGLLLGYMASRIRPQLLLRIGYVLLGAGLFLTPLAGEFAPYLAFTDGLVDPPMVALLLISALSAFGIGIANPTLSTLCSNVTPQERQGEMFGLLQAARSAGFIVGPILGGALFDAWMAGPYFLAGGVAFLAALLVNVPKRADHPVADGA